MQHVIPIVRRPLRCDVVLPMRRHRPGSRIGFLPVHRCRGRLTILQHAIMMKDNVQVVLRPFQRDAVGGVREYRHGQGPRRLSRQPYRQQQNRDDAS